MANSPISAYISIYNLLALEKVYRKPNPIFLSAKLKTRAVSRQIRYLLSPISLETKP